MEAISAVHEHSSCTMRGDSDGVVDLVTRCATVGGKGDVRSREQRRKRNNCENRGVDE